jgi:hypothetical protein
MGGRGSNDSGYGHEMGGGGGGGYAGSSSVDTMRASAGGGGGAAGGSAGAAAGGGMSLGGPKTKKASSFMAAMATEDGITAAPPPAMRGGSAPPASAGLAPGAIAAPVDPVHVSIEERLSVSLNRDGGVTSVEVKGALSITCQVRFPALFVRGLQAKVHSWTAAAYPVIPHPLRACAPRSVLCCRTRLTARFESTWPQTRQRMCFSSRQTPTCVLVNFSAHLSLPDPRTLVAQSLPFQHGCSPAPLRRSTSHCTQATARLR